MSSRNTTNRIGALIASLVVAIGCSGAGTAPAADRVELSVFAAASLRDALAAVETAYEAAVPRVRVSVATDSSATLRTQIEQGAPADVFLSADQVNPHALVDAGLGDGEPVDFAGNALTVVVPPDNPAGIATPADLGRLGVKVVAAGDEVPITGYAREVVANLGGLPGYPSDLAAAYAANIVSQEENVRAILAKIELGEGDAAFVYVTDARASDRVKAIAIPPEANMPVWYSGVVVRTTAHPTEAHAFLDWLGGADGAAVLGTFGFSAPS